MDDETDPKRLVNSNLLRIKAEMSDSLMCDDFDEEFDEIGETYDEIGSQPPRQQQFYQDLDMCLHGLTRDRYICELQKCCQNEYAKISDYRDKLSERAKQLPTCPIGRLVNRRNSSHASRQKKCATDCFMLQTFVNGSVSRDINEVFSNPQQPNDTMGAIEFDENEHGDFVKPDMYALMFKMQSDITEVSRKQASDSFTLQQIQQDVTKMAVLFRTFQGTLNSILARSQVHNTTPQVTKLQSDVSKLSSSIATINQRIVDNQISNTNNANETLNVQPSVPTYAEVIASPVSIRDSSQNLTNEITTTSPPTKIETNKQVGISEKRESGKINKRRTQHYGNRESVDTESCDMAPPSRAHEETINKETPIQNTSVNTGKFVAAKRKKISSYYIGNIDISVDKQDVYDYLTGNGVTPTKLDMFYGRHGSAAKINIFYEDESKVESENFWPNEITCRKWINRPDWEREKQHSKRNHQDRHKYTSNRVRNKTTRGTYNKSKSGPSGQYRKHYRYDDYDNYCKNDRSRERSRSRERPWENRNTDQEYNDEHSSDNDTRRHDNNYWAANDTEHWA